MEEIKRSYAEELEDARYVYNCGGIAVERLDEPEVTNMRSPKQDSSRVRDKPMFGNRDMCALMCMVCSVLITYLMYENGKIICDNTIQLIITVVALVHFIWLGLFLSTQKIIRLCCIRAKRKATDKVGD